MIIDGSLISNTPVGESHMILYEEGADSLAYVLIACGVEIDYHTCSRQASATYYFLRDKRLVNAILKALRKEST